MLYNKNLVQSWSRNGTTVLTDDAVLTSVISDNKWADLQHRGKDLAACKLSNPPPYLVHLIMLQPVLAPSFH